jgi:UDP-glucose 4-epimerase
MSGSVAKPPVMVIVLDDNKYFAADLIDSVAVSYLFSKNTFDYVIQRAANINNDEGFAMFSNNLISTLNIVEASLSSGIENIFHTSGVLVIRKILELPITEEHPANPLTAHHLSKLQSKKS